MNDSETDQLDDEIGALSEYKCRRCGQWMGIAGGGQTWTDEDLATQEYYDSQVDYHESGECSAVQPAVRLRNDGKVARTPLLGLGPSHARLSVPPKRRIGPIQNWHELVSRGPVGSEARRKERREAVRHGKMLVLNTYEPNRAMRREAHGRGYNPGQLDQHRTRLHARGGGGIDRAATRVRRRAERLAAAA